MKRPFAIVLVVMAVFAAIGATLSFAQQKQAAPDRTTVVRVGVNEGLPAPEGDVVFTRAVQGPDGPPPPGMPGDFVFIANEMNFGGKVVKGAPYSAQAVTESVQTLSDGNRIVNKTTAGVYRDSEGRTRREQTLRSIGAFANSGEAPQTVFINDPVTGTSFVLEPRTKVARKMPPMSFSFAFRAPAPGEKARTAPETGAIERVETERFQMRVPEGGAGMAGPASQVVWGMGNHVATNEALGKQNVEGVEAEGTRSTLTIPAGEVGNERAIEIINERWYSAELQTVVMTRHSDPRFGESTYRLTNIDRSEPARSLFEVPADFTIKSGPGGRGEAFGYGPGINIVTGGSAGVSSSAIRGGALNGKATSLPPPEYPEGAKAAHASGVVTVEVTIDEEGNVVAARAISGHPLLQASSVAAARRAKFSPTKLSGQAVKVQGVITYTFSAD